MASFYESTNQVKKASAAFDGALALRPKDSMTRQRYAQMLQRSGNAADAVTQYIVLLKNNPTALGHNYWELMETFFQAGKVDELVSIAKDMIAPSVGQSFVNYFAQSVAQRCIENNNAKAAVEIYKMIHEVQPNRQNTYAEIASAYSAAGEREKAIEFLRENLESESTTISQNPHLQVGIVSKLTELYKASGNIQSLLTEYEDKLAEEPGAPSLLYLVASMKIAANDLDGSDPLVNLLLDDKIVSMNAKRLSSLADAYRSAGDRNRELRLLEAATEKLDPQNSWQLSEIYRKLGAVYTQHGEKEKAKRIAVFTTYASPESMRLKIMLMTPSKPLNKRLNSDRAMGRLTASWRNFISAKTTWILLKWLSRKQFNTLDESGNDAILKGR